MAPQWGPLLPGQRPVMGKREIELGQAMHEQTEELLVENSYDVVLRDNRSSTNRRPSEGTLFVGRDPFQVRSLVETGVSVNRDHETGRLVIELNNPVSKPEYSIDFVITDDIHKLCVCCYDVLNYFCQYREERAKFDATSPGRGAVFRLPNTVIHHANLFSLHAHAKMSKCHVCNMLIERIEYRWDIKHPQYEDYRFEMAFPQHVPKDESDALSFAMVRCDQKKYPVWNWTPLLRLKLWPEDKYGHHFKADSHASYMRSKRGDPVDSDEDEDVAHPPPHKLAAAWLAGCMANEAGKHMPCKRQNSGYLPTRLLDVRHALKSSKLLIVCPQDDPARFSTNRHYATLSHCWGSWGAAENPNLTEANLEVRKKDGLSCDSLPATFRDAITVCTWLRIPYLWIDSLCIVQDSRLDWIHEASVMHHTYEFGTVNISAAGGNDSRSGLFAKRDYEAFSLQRFQAPKIHKTWSVTSDNMFAWTTTAPAFSRAWIHRERQIAPRILHFTPEGMVVWECCGTDGVSFKSESLPGGAPFEDLWYGNTKFQTPTMISSSKKGNEATYAVWNDMCEKFSTRSLTVKSDMPIILSSLAEEFQKLLPDDEYLAGMWRNTLPQSLVWHTHKYWPEGDTSKIAPTWSWLSAPAPIGVKFVEKVNMEQLLPLARIVDVSIVQEEGHEDNKYGPVKSGILRLKGFLRKIWIDFDDDDKFRLSVVDALVDGDEDDHERSHLRVVGKSWDEYEGEVCEVNLDGPATDKEYCCWCMFTSIEEWVNSDDWTSQDRTVTAILLERAGDDDDERWVRIGTMTMHELIAFKMRYKDCWEWDTTRESEAIEDAEDEKKEAVIDSPVDDEHNRESGKDSDEQDDDDSKKTVCLTATDTETSDHAIHHTPVDNREPAQDSSHVFRAEDNQPVTITTPVSNNDTCVTVVDPGNDTDGGHDSDHTPKPGTDASSRSSSQCSKDSDAGLWTKLSKLIKYDRHKVARAEKAERQKQRDAEKALKKNSEVDLPSADSEENVRTSNLKEEETQDIPSTTNEGVTSERHNSNTITTTIEDDAFKDTHNANLDTPSPSVLSRIDSPSNEDNTNSTEVPIDSSGAVTTDKAPNMLPTPNSPPIHGFIHASLSPLEALYQFDGAIRELHEQGMLGWLRRLDVRTIEIV